MTTVDHESAPVAIRGRSGQVERTATFPLETRGRGYECAAVDAFLARARAAFEDDPDAEPLTAQAVRDASFPLARRGYVIPAVDAALGRIEDAFAARERADAVATVGARAWVAQQRSLAQEVLNRLTRPPRRRFERVGVLRHGYRIDEVDLVADKLTAYLAEGEKVTPEQVRSVAFRMQRGGYRENQVDAVLDAVLEIMLAVG